MEELLEKLESKKKIYRIVLMTISTILSAILYNTFLLPLSLVTGGTPGIATITHYLYDINPALMLFLLSLACTILSFRYLGVRRTTGTIVASITYPLLVQLTSNLNGLINPEEIDILLMVLLAGILSGVANGLMYKSGYSNGGFPIVSQILYEKHNISISKSSLVINVTIVLIGAYFFGITNALYAIIFLYINNLVLDKVLLGISNNKAFYIITEEDEKVKEYIINTLHHNVTTFEVKGGYLDKKRQVILTVIPTREYYKATSSIKKIDKDAFFVATDSYTVEGAK